MNTTTAMVDTSPTHTFVEPWFVPLDILQICCTSSAIILIISLLCIVAVDRLCHTPAMLLLANSYLALSIFASNRLGSCVFALHNDLNQLQHQDSLCVLRAYSTMAPCATVYYSFLLQAVYRYIVVNYPNRLFWQSAGFQALLICSTWIFSYLSCIPMLFTGDIEYNTDSQICEPPLQLSFILVYLTCFGYLVPICVTMCIYFKLFRYVKEMGKRVTVANALLRVRRELRMVQHTITLLGILLALGIPYTVFWCISFFTTPPKYHYRITFIFIDVSILFVVIISFKFTEPLRTSVKKAFDYGKNIVRPTGT